MLGWSIWFFAAAIIAAIFGFGGIASAFAGIAQILFWVFLALLLLSLVFGMFHGGPAVVGDGHVSHSRGGGGLAMLAVALVVGFAVYAWFDNDMSAERAGRELDQTAATISAEAGEAVEEAGDRAQNLVDDTADEVRTDAANGLNEAEERVEGTEG